MQNAASMHGSRRTPRILEGKVSTVANSTHQQSLQAYQNGLQLMQEGKFEKARAVFEKLIASGPVEVLERCRVYLQVCQNKLAEGTRNFSSPEEHYDYAISLLNTGDYSEARDHFEQILDGHPMADYAHYGLEALDSMTMQAEECLEHMAKAIELNPRNRIQARTDSDFHNMIEDPRFTELLYPEIL
jgi:outer membrane protein assembly factor BamD (BamD/ComL family)